VPACEPDRAGGDQGSPGEDAGFVPRAVIDAGGAEMPVQRTGTVQEVFLICVDADAAKAWLIESGIAEGDGRSQIEHASLCEKMRKPSLCLVSLTACLTTAYRTNKAIMRYFIQKTVAFSRIFSR